jgi:myosin heavy subunit
MSSVQSSIASIELLRKQLEDANVKALRLEARCQTISTSNANLEKLLLEINKTNSHMDEEMQNVEKWNRFYDGHLQNGYRSLAMVKEASNKKWQQYQDDAKRINSHNEALRKEVQDRKDRYDKNVELIWKKIPGFSEKLEKEQMISSLKEKLKSLKLEQNKSGTSPAPTNDRKLLDLKEKRLQLEREEAHQLKILEGLNKAMTLNENSKKSSPVVSPAMENVNMEAITMSNGKKEL